MKKNFVYQKMVLMTVKLPSVSTVYKMRVKYE